MKRIRDEMKPNKYQLTSHQTQALDLLLAGRTITQAAEEVGITRETLSRWRNHDPAFQAAYNAALRSAWEACQSKLLEKRVHALDELAELIDSENDALALRACKALLKLKAVYPGGTIDPEEIDHEKQLFDALEYLKYSHYAQSDSKSVDNRGRQ